jgi:hypothetical protein
MNRVSVHLDERPPMLTPCRLADGWAAFERDAFANLGLDARTHALHELWLCSRDGTSEAMISRDALHALRDLDHVRVTVVLRAAELDKGALADAAPPTAVAAPHATPATAALALPAPSLAARAVQSEAPAAAHVPPAVVAAAAASQRAEPAQAVGEKQPAAAAAPAPPAAVSVAATPLHRAQLAAPPSQAGGEKRLAEGAGTASAVVKRPRTATAPRVAAGAGAAGLLALTLPRTAVHAANPFPLASFSFAVFAALQREGKSIRLQDLMAATQDLFDWSKVRQARSARDAAALAD